MPSAKVGTPPRARWRLASAAPLPLLLVLFAVWTGLMGLDATGFHLAWGLGDFGEWLVLAVVTVFPVAALWAPQRPLRILGYAFYSLDLAFGFGAAGVIAIVHAFGGPGGEPAAPTWALVAFGGASVLCALALLALAALLVDDIRSVDAEGD